MKGRLRERRTGVTLASGRSLRATEGRRPSITPLFDLVEVPLDARTQLVAPRGELDVATNPAFRAAVQAALERTAERLVLDLSEVSFMSAGALGVIARARAQMEAGAGKLIVICPSPRLLRLFEIGGLAGKLEILASREAVPA